MHPINRVQKLIPYLINIFKDYFECNSLYPVKKAFEYVSNLEVHLFSGRQYLIDLYVRYTGFVCPAYSFCLI
jgi:hypothetical protein